MIYYNKLSKLWLTKQFAKGLYGGAKKSKIKWTSFVHNGVMFPEPYQPHNLPVMYNGEKVFFNNKIAEEYATLYARYNGTEYASNKTFNKNFWKDWKKILGDGHEIKNLEGCDFSIIFNYLVKQKEKKREMSKEEKEKAKEERDKKTEPYKFAYVDNVKQPVANFRVEPPGIFIGRGCHPKLGRIKRRILPKDITLNLSKDAPIPKLQSFYQNKSWGKIIHDNTLEWLASWTDDITGKKKYVWLGAQSDLRTRSDLAKFDLARMLKKKIHKIRRINDANLQDTDLRKRQIATAVYFIDNFALRVGNEKGSDAADTVGVTNLRVEHIELLDENKIKLDFLGKDSIRYINKIKVPIVVYNNLAEFMGNKNKKDSLFDQINSADVNKYLRKFMKGLTAKVFRTFNASYYFQKELKNVTTKYKNYDKEDKVDVLLNEFNKANTKIAALCNHQKKASKTHDKQVDAINQKIKNYKKKLKKIKTSTGKNKTARIEKLRNKIKELRAKKSMKIEQKNLSLGTSKINYIDPRITIAFMKKHGLEIDKIFSKTLQSKFKWAFDVSDDFKF